MRAEPVFNEVPRGWRAVALEGIVVTAAFLVLAVVVTWPLVLHLDTRIHDGVDAVFQAWNIDWVQHALLTHRNVYDTNIFAPETLTLVYSDTLIGTSVLLFPFRAMGMSPAGVYNVGILLGFAFSAAAAYALGRTITGSAVVGAVAGAAYSFGTLNAVEGGHIQTVMRPGPPLAALGAWMLAERAGTGRAQWPWAALLVGATVWQASSSIYFATYALIAVAVVLACRWRAFRHGRWRALAVTLAVTLAGVALFLVPYVIVRNRFAHAGITKLGAPFSLHPTQAYPGLLLWGWIGAKPGQFPGFPGATLLVLAPVGWFVARRDRVSRSVRTLGLALVVVGFVLALAYRPDTMFAYLPYRFLHDYVPGFSALRSAARVWTIGLLGLGLLAGLATRGIATWISQRSSLRTAVTVSAVVVVSLVALDGYAPWHHLARVGVSPVDHALARIHDPGGVLYLPVSTNRKNVLDLVAFAQPTNIYGTTVHHRRTPNGYSGYFPPSYFAMSRLMRTLPSPSALRYLRRAGVRFIVLRRRGVHTAWAYLGDPARAAPLRYRGRFGDDLLYEIPGAR